MAEDASEPAGLRWTGHPLVDAGTAGLTIYAGRAAPDQVTGADLEEFVTWAARAVVQPALSSYVSVLFTINGYLNPSFSAEKKTDEATALMRTYLAAPNPSLSKCAYCGRPAGRVVSRDQAPMLTGRGVVNFFPGGAPGLALCGLCVLSLQGLIVGGLNCGGRALVVAGPDSDLLLEIVREWWTQTAPRLQLYLAKGEKPPTISGPRSRVIEVLAAVARRARAPGRDTGVVAYHLSNSGQGPAADLYPLAALVVRFVRLAQLDSYRPAWQALARRGYWISNNRKELPDEQQQRARNRFFDDLYTLPGEAGPFVRRHLLQPIRELAAPSSGSGKATRTVASPVTGAGLAPERYWTFTELLLKEVLRMQAERVTAIRRLGDELAGDIARDNDRGLFRRSVGARSYREVRLSLLRASRARLLAGREPLIDFEGFLLVFEEGEEVARVDWRLAWDLTVLRLFQRLYELEWFGKNQEVLAEAALGDEDDETTEGA